MAMDIITRTVEATEADYSEISFSDDGSVVSTPLQTARFGGVLNKSQVVSALSLRYGEDKNFVIRNLAVTKKRYAISLDDFLRYAKEMPVRGTADETVSDEDEAVCDNCDTMPSNESDTSAKTSDDAEDISDATEDTEDDDSDLPSDDLPSEPPF